jgi:hypothetical protein
MDGILSLRQLSNTGDSYSVKKSWYLRMRVSSNTYAVRPEAIAPVWSWWNGPAFYML